MQQIISTYDKWYLAFKEEIYIFLNQPAWLSKWNKMHNDYLYNTNRFDDPIVLTLAILKHKYPFSQRNLLQ